jgi:hypothetical protein
MDVTTCRASLNTCFSWRETCSFLITASAPRVAKLAVSTCSIRGQYRFAPWGEPHTPKQGYIYAFAQVEYAPSCQRSGIGLKSVKIIPPDTFLMAYIHGRISPVSSTISREPCRLRSPTPCSRFAHSGRLYQQRTPRACSVRPPQP